MLVAEKRISELRETNSAAKLYSTASRQTGASDHKRLASYCCRNPWSVISNGFMFEHLSELCVKLTGLGGNEVAVLFAASH